jgi:ATP-dependent Lon protease
VVAAAGAGLKTVMLPARNRRDFEDIPASARERLEFRWIEHVDEAAKIALGVDVGRETEPIMAEADVAEY